MPPTRIRLRRGLALALAALPAAAGWAASPKEAVSPLDAKEFFRPELSISNSNRPLADVLAQLPNRAAWEVFLQERSGAGSGHVSAVFIDPRSGAATNLVGSFPLIPGDGAGNHVTTAALGQRLGRTLDAVDEQVVGQAVLQFVRAHRALLGIDPAQLGPVRARAASAQLWHVTIPQVYQGLPVRHGHLVAALSHGNLVIIGTESWGDVRLDVAPRVGAEDALAAGFGFADGRRSADLLLREPALEIVPFAPPEHQKGEAFGGPVGAGYGHRLVWTFVFQRTPELARWEVTVDAASGEVIAFEDANRYAIKQATGGVYPATNTEVCPTSQTCGTMQTGWPMPFADTGLAAPNDFTGSAGTFEYTSGTATSTLSGRFIRVADACGAITLSSPTGTLAFGGVNGDHDCATAGSPGNTAASRTAFYELNKVKELARGWLPSNTWLQSVLVANVNNALTCSALWDGSSVHFYRGAGSGCRNTGEIASFLDHEWGHGLDQNDTGGQLSNSSEAYGDIAANFRQQSSCVGYGFLSTAAPGCGRTSDNTGNNANEAQQGAAHCDLDCSGVRDSDWAKHSPATPDTPLGFVCTSCVAGSGPCGRSPVCAAAPARQAAWDLVARDLRGAPFNLDDTTAFIVGNRLLYQGSGLIGAWHSCTCGGTSDGCGATNGYMNWLAADDDDGNLANGTPHMTALFAAFDRHQIACAAPAPQNSGCAGGPTEMPGLTVAPGNNQVALSWNTVPGATRYWVLRGEGVDPCASVRVRLAEVTGTSYTDTQVAGGRAYSYSLLAAGASDACFTRDLGCITATPASVAAAPAALAVDAGGNGVLQPNEGAVAVAPTWRNTGVQAVSLSGVLSAFTGPSGPTYTIDDPVSDYGTLPADTSRQCSNCYAVSIAGATRPAQHWDASVLETMTFPASTKTWTLHVGDSFADVPASSPFYRFVEALLHKGITTGCAAASYCPGSSTTREQMAAFVLVAKEGPGYMPPACVPPNLFTDVPETSPFCRFVEELAGRGVVNGCASGLFCPAAPVTREQMAVFVLRTLDPNLTPPACGTPVFGDVPASSPFCRWIEELFRRNVVTGCATNPIRYCPTGPVTREQMGVFLGLTFGLSLYGL